MRNHRDTATLAELSSMDTLNVEQAAQLLQLGRDATHALIDSGQIPALTCNQKHTVMLRTDVLAFIGTEAHKQAEQRRKASQAHSPRAKRGRTLPDLPPLEENPS